MVWRTDGPGKESIELWTREYPDMQCVPTRIEQMNRAGYLVVENFPMSEEAWLNYYSPLDARMTEGSDTQLTSRTPEVQDTIEKIKILESTSL